jgi:signal peptidase II
VTERGPALAVWLYATATLAYLLDRGSKLLVEQALAGEPPLRLVPGVLTLNYTTNSGGAFGFGRSAPWLFAAASIVVSVVIVAVSFRQSRLPVAIGLGLILGGALGNLTDRAVNGPGLSGHVTDFIDFQVWPVFNLADTAIVAGAILLALSTAVHDEPEETSQGA